MTPDPTSAPRAEEEKDSVLLGRAVPGNSGKGAPRRRDERLLRDTLSMLCNFVWTRQLRPGEHLWSIPADQERDFDFIISDAIAELVELRSLREGRAPQPVSGTLVERLKDAAKIYDPGYIADLFLEAAKYVETWHQTGWNTVLRQRDAALDVVRQERGLDAVTEIMGPAGVAALSADAAPSVLSAAGAGKAVIVVERCVNCDSTLPATPPNGYLQEREQERDAWKATADRFRQSCNELRAQLATERQRRAQVEQALRKVRAHTSYLPDADRQFLADLLASIERIADAALKALEDSHA